MEDNERIMKPASTPRGVSEYTTKRQKTAAREPTAGIIYDHKIDLRYLIRPVDLVDSTGPPPHPRRRRRFSPN